MDFVPKVYFHQYFSAVISGNNFNCSLFNFSILVMLMTCAALAVSTLTMTQFVMS